MTVENNGTQVSGQGAEENEFTKQSPMTQREPAQEPAQEPEQEPAPQEQPEHPGQQPPQQAEEVGEEAPQDLVGMIGDELMQDPASKIAAQQLQHLCEGLDIQRAFGAAYQYEDTTRIDMAYLTEKLGADKAQQVLETADFLMNYADTLAERIENDLYAGIEGGRAALEQSAAIFNKVADPSTRAIVADLLDSGDLRYMKHAVSMIQQAASSAGGQYKHVRQPAFSGAQLQPMSREEYLQAIADPNLTDAKYQELRQRYAASRSN